MSAGSRIRGRARIVSVDEVPGGLQVVVHATIEREGGDKPACIAECVVRALARTGLYGIIDVERVLVRPRGGRR
ncbi:hypothetical protein ACQP2U_10240 [Nocardia sp. CA-084685]|uniref:hypothetical protein n=1 Tax=Nocardia sp. CA-084685 TaxID=3239970 RepID=UPI003D95B2DF